MSLLSDIINNTEGLYRGNLRHYFKCLFNSRGAGNPYHNIRHSCTILIRCYEAIKYYEWGKCPVFQDLELLDNRILLCAALFHDYNHSGRAGNDDLNIELATRGWEKCCVQEDRVISSAICGLIRLTEFGPTGHVSPALDERERVLRDADLSQALDQSWIRMVIYGLAEEMQIKPEEMLRMQEGFLSKVKFESEWGRERFGGAIQEKIEEARELVKILDS